MKSRKGKILIRVGAAVLSALAIAAFCVVYYIHTHIPAEIVPDIRAAIGARGERDADARFKKYLENLYGSMDDPAHRETAFKDFFNRDHIKAMRLIVKYSPPDQRGANIQATAKWLANYRQDMTPQEKTDLANYFQSDAGRAALQGATAQFMSQDAEYRSATTPVINQLMTILTGVKQ